MEQLPPNVLERARIVYDQDERRINDYFEKEIIYEYNMFLKLKPHSKKTQPELITYKTLSGGSNGKKKSRKKQSKTKIKQSLKTKTKQSSLKTKNNKPSNRYSKSSNYNNIRGSGVQKIKKNTQ